MVVATILAIVLLASHPELRLLVPFVDALGIDLFVVLLGTQVWGYGRSRLAWLVRSWALPAGRRA